MGGLSISRSSYRDTSMSGAEHVACCAQGMGSRRADVRLTHTVLARRIAQRFLMTTVSMPLAHHILFYIAV